MATEASINARRIRAIQRIEAHAQALAERFGVQPLELPMQGRVPSLVQAQQLEAVVDWLALLTDNSLGMVEAVSGSFGLDNPVLVPWSELYESMTVADLQKMAEERGVDLGRATRKADIIQALLEARSATDSRTTD